MRQRTIRRRPAIFSVTPGTSLELTGSRIYETGVKQLLWGGKAEWTFAAYDIRAQNVYVQVNDTTSTLAGEIRSKGVEMAAAVRPVEDIKIWGNVALTMRITAISISRGVVERQHAVERRAAHHKRRRVLSLRQLALAGGDRRLGASCRQPLPLWDDATTMLAYTTADLYAFVDIPAGICRGRASRRCASASGCAT